MSKFVKEFRIIAKIMRTGKADKGLFAASKSKKSMNEVLQGLHRVLAGGKSSAGMNDRHFGTIKNIAKREAGKTIDKDKAEKLVKALDNVQKAKPNVKFIRKNGRVIPIRVKK
jgi:hypothetical protein